MYDTVAWSCCYTCTPDTQLLPRASRLSIICWLNLTHIFPYFDRPGACDHQHLMDSAGKRTDCKYSRTISSTFIFLILHIVIDAPGNYIRWAFSGWSSNYNQASPLPLWLYWTFTIATRILSTLYELWLFFCLYIHKILLYLQLNGCNRLLRFYFIKFNL